MIDALFLIGILLFAIGVGNVLLAWSKYIFSDAIEELVFSIGLGFGFLGYSIFFLGIIHLLYVPIICVLLVLGIALSAKNITHLILRLKTDVRNFKINQSFLTIFLSFLVLMLLTIVFLKCFVPPIQNDALVYHLDTAKRFLKYHELKYFPYTANSTFPLMVEMFYVVALALKGTALAQMIHCCMGVATSLAVFSIARKILRFEFAFLSSVIFLTIPGIFHQMPTAYNDVGLTFFFVFQLYSIWKWVETGEYKWMVLAGCFAGFDLSVKLIAVLGIATIGIASLFFCKREQIKKTFSGFFIFAAFALLTSFAWYLRSYLLTGNPVFPFFPKLFGGVGHEYFIGKHGMGKGLLDFLLSPWNVIFKPTAFGGRGNQLGPLFILMFPSLLIAIKFINNSKLIKFLSLCSICYFFLWFWGPQNLRFFFPITVAYSILLGFLFQNLICSSKIGLRFTGFTFLFSGLIFNVFIAVYFLRTDYMVALGLEDKAVFLRRNERSYPVAEFVNRNLPANSIILSQEARSFYFDPDIARYRLFLQRERIHQDAPLEELVKSMKSSGIVYLLLVDPINAVDLKTPPSFEEIKSFTSTIPSEPPVLYRLFKVK